MVGVRRVGVGKVGVRMVGLGEWELGLRLGYRQGKVRWFRLELGYGVGKE